MKNHGGEVIEGYKKPGHQGQRYEVRYRDGFGIQRIFGWTNDPEAAAIRKSIARQPLWSGVRIVDLYPERG